MENVQSVYQNTMNRGKGRVRCFLKKIKIYHLLYLCIFLEMAWIISYYLSPVGMASLDSDSTLSIQFLQQVMEEKKLYPENWIYTNTIGFPLTTPIMLLFYKITKDYIVTVMFNYIAYVFFMLVSIWYFAGHVMKMGKALTAISIFILLSPGSAEYFRDIFFTGYTFRVTKFLILLGYGLQCVPNEDLDLNLKYMCLYAGAVFLFVMGDMRYVAILILPLIVTMAVVYLTENYEKDIKTIFLPLKRFFLYLLIVGAAVFACIVIEKLLKSRFPFVEGFFGASLITDLSDMWGNLQAMVSTYIAAFGFAGGVPQMSIHAVLSLCALLFAVYILVINPVIMLVDYKKLPFVLKQLVVYRWTSYAVIIFFWLFTSGISFRHALTFFVLDILTAVYYFADKLLVKGKVIKVFGCAVLIVFTAFNWSHTSWLNVFDQWNSQDAVSALKDRDNIIEEIKDKGLTYGYAPFWTASVTAAFSQEELKIYPWNLNDRYRWYAPNELYLLADQDQPTFLLMTQEEYQEYQEEYRFRMLWGDYEKIIHAYGYVLFVYDYNIATNFKEYCHLSKNLLKHMTVSEGGGQKTADASAIYLKPDAYIFGPYVDLQGGTHTLEVAVNGKAFLNIYAMDVKDGENVTNSICRAELKNGRNQVPFFLIEDTQGVEFRIENKDSERIAVTGLSLVQGGDYKLLSQMQVSKQNEKNTADAVYLSSGETLYGPYLGAKEGRYLLKVTVSGNSKIDIWADKGKQKIVQQDLSEGENQIFFELYEDVMDLEFVVRNTNSKELAIKDLQMEKKYD